MSEPTLMQSLWRGPVVVVYQTVTPYTGQTMKAVADSVCVPRGISLARIKGRERIKAWTDDNYEAETILDAAKLDKFIVSQMEIADGLEQIVFQNMKQTGTVRITSVPEHEADGRKLS